MAETHERSRSPLRRTMTPEVSKGAPVLERIAAPGQPWTPHPGETLTIHDFHSSKGTTASDVLSLLRRERLVVRNRAVIRPPVAPGLLDNCLLLLPRGAVEFLRVCPNIQDKTDPQRLWLGRVWQLRSLLTQYYQAVRKWHGMSDTDVPAETKELEERIRNDAKLFWKILKIQAIWRSAMQRRLWVLDNLEHHVSGVVVFMHGSGGMTGNNLRFARMLAAMGYLVIAPDDMASSRFRKRELVSLATSDTLTDYWDDNLVYASSTSGEYAYNTQVETVLRDPNKYKALYEKVYAMRRSELHYVLQHLPSFTTAVGVYIMGTSEGAMTVSRFDDQRYGPLINGRIISAFSVEYCYFTPTEIAGQFGGSLDVPTLQLIGSHDEYFGTHNSIAQLVAADPHRGYGSKRLAGHAFETMKQQAMQTGCVCVFDEGLHDLTVTADNALREIFATFLRRPYRISQLHKIWVHDPANWQQIEVLDEQHDEGNNKGLLLIRVKKSSLPQTIARNLEKRLRLLHGWDQRELMQAHRKMQSSREDLGKAAAQSRLGTVTKLLSKDPLFDAVQACDQAAQ